MPLLQLRNSSTEETTRLQFGRMQRVRCVDSALHPSLHKNVPRAALEDNRLYVFLALVDAKRDGPAWERDLAARELKKRLEARPHAGSKA